MKKRRAIAPCNCAAQLGQYQITPEKGMAVLGVIDPLRVLCHLEISIPELLVLDAATSWTQELRLRFRT